MTRKRLMLRLLLALLVPVALLLLLDVIPFHGVEVESATAVMTSSLTCDQQMTTVEAPDKTVQAKLVQCKIGAEAAPATAIFLQFAEGQQAVDLAERPKINLALVAVGLTPTHLAWRADGVLAVTLPSSAEITSDMRRCTWNTAVPGLVCVASTLVAIEQQH